MNKIHSLAVACVVLASGCKSQQQKAAVQGPQATPVNAAQKAEEDLAAKFLRQEMAFLGIPADDPILSATDTRSLTPAQIQKKRALNTLLYIDGIVFRAKQDVDKAGAGPDLQKASEHYDLALLRADLIRGDIKAGRIDKATLRVGKMTSPITPDEQALLDARNSTSDIQSLVNGRSQR